MNHALHVSALIGSILDNDHVACLKVTCTAATDIDLVRLCIRLCSRHVPGIGHRRPPHHHLNVFTDIKVCKLLL